MFHYENLHMQNIKLIFFQLQKLKFSEKLEKTIKIIFNIIAQTLIVGRRRGGSNEYPQSMFWIKNKKNRYTPVKHSFTI